MAYGVKPTRIDREGYPLPDEVSISGTVSGDAIDWDSAPGMLGFDQWKQPVRVATTASITIATALNAGDTLDGVTLAAGDRVLVKDQGTASQNGIYIVDASPYRAPDLDEDAEALGAVVYVIAGTDNAATIWTLTNTSAVTVGTTAQTWAQIGDGGGGAGGSVTLEVVALSGAAVTVDYATATWWDITLTAACTLTITNPPADQTVGQLHLVLRQGGSGSYAVTWPASVDWPDTDGTGGGAAPTLHTVVGAQDVIVLTTFDGGLTWGGSYDSGGAAVAALDDLTDVVITAVADGDVLTYETGTSKWVNAVPAAASTTHWEPLMASGSASPLETSDGLDWIFVEVPN